MHQGGSDNRVDIAIGLGLDPLVDLRPVGAEHEPAKALSFAGRWGETGQKVAVKIADPSVGANLKAAFEGLASAASKALPDPIALLCDAQGRRCLVSAWVQGRSAAEQDLPRSAALLSGWIDLARGLAQLHRQKLWHGDPSLANVVVRPDAGMSWIDFGLLGHHGGGTFGYFAPETLQGQGGAPADVFGLACLMGRMWTGVLPFPDLKALSTWKAQGSLPLAWVQAKSLLPDALAKLLLAMMDPDPEARPGIEDVVVELELVSTTLFDREAPSQRWRDPGRLPYLGDQLEALMQRWSQLGSKPELLAVRGAAGSGRRRLLEELGMRLQAQGHRVERIDVPDPALAPSLLTARWLDGQGGDGDRRTLVVTGLCARAWIQSLGGVGAFEALKGLACGPLVMADSQESASMGTPEQVYCVNPWSREVVASALSHYWRGDAIEAERREAWVDWLLSHCEGRAGQTVRELRKIAAAQASDAASWALFTPQDDAEVFQGQEGWTLARLCRADQGSVVDTQAAVWQGWPAADQLALALAYAQSGWSLRPENARVLLCGLLAQGLSDKVLACASSEDPGALFVRARALQAGRTPGESDQGSQAAIEALRAHEDPSAQVAGAALALRAQIDAGHLRDQALDTPPMFDQAQPWAKNWWTLWSSYAQLGRSESKALAGLRSLTLQSAGMSPLERAPILARAAQLLGNHAWERGHRAQAHAHYQECTQWFQAGGESVGEAMAAGNMAALAFSRGELSVALRSGERAIAALVALDAWQPVGALLNNHIRVLGVLGRKARAKALFDRAMQAVQTGSLEAARLELAMAQAQALPVGDSCMAALSCLLERAPAIEALDAWIRVSERALEHAQFEVAQRLAQIKGKSSKLDGQDDSLLGRWAQILDRQIGGQPLSEAYWEQAKIAWQTLAENEDPVMALGWSRRLLLLCGQGGQATPSWLEDRQGFEALLEKVVATAPYSDKSFLMRRFQVATPSRRAPHRQRPVAAQPPATRPAQAFGGPSALLHHLEGWSQCSSLEQLQEGLLDAVLSWAQAERGMLVLRETQGQRVVAREYGSRVSGLATSTTIVEGVFARGEGVVTIDARSDDRFEHAPSVTHLNLRSVLAAPLRDLGGVFGVIYLDARMRRGAFGDEHLEALEYFARVASLLWRQTSQRLELQGQVANLAQHNAGLTQRLEQRELEGLRLRETRRNQGPGPDLDYFGVLGRSEKMRQVTQLLDRYAGSSETVVLVGESGTGKKSCVKALHAASCGADAPLVMQDLAQVPAGMVRQILFGSSGSGTTNRDARLPSSNASSVSSPTGSSGGRGAASLFEIAAGGVVYLEGIETLDDALQKELLGYLEANAQSRKARLVVGCKMGMETLVDEGVLRKDLYYRLAVLRIELPPLRQRLDDLPELVQHWLAQRGRSDLSISAAALRSLSRYAWPGNLRELEQEVSRLAVMCEARIEKEDLSPWVLSGARNGGEDPDDLRLRPRVEALEREIIARALERSQGNQSHAASLLGLSRFGLQKKLRRWAQEEQEAGS